jgi:hypothetical protein
MSAPAILDYTGNILSCEEVQGVANDSKHHPIQLLLLARTGLDDSKAKLLSEGLRHSKCASTLKCFRLLMVCHIPY